MSRRTGIILCTTSAVLNIGIAIVNFGGGRVILGSVCVGVAVACLVVAMLWWLFMEGGDA